MMKRIELFFSYAHRDEKLLEKLIMQLTPLRREGLSSMWHYRDISAGTEWQKEIDKHLGTAHIILLLISPDFMASDYCSSVELKQAIMRHERGDARVIPIILRRVHWEGILGPLQALPTNAKPVTSWNNRDEAFFNISEGIRRVIEELNIQLPSDSLLGNTQIWPEFSDYNQALSDIRSTVYDTDIQAGSLAHDSRPLILTRTFRNFSGYAAIYKIGDWAVKCFYRTTYTRGIVPPSDLRERYQAINEYINMHSSMLPFLVPQVWVERGICVNRKDWPFVKSPFLNAPTLGEFLADRHTDRSTVAGLAKQWLTIITILESLHIAHGNLDVNNVLVYGNYPNITLRLVDFDNTGGK